MSIFTKQDEKEHSATPSPTPPPAQRPRRLALPAGKRSFLGEGCDFKGELSGEGSFECRGRFDGTIDIEEDLVIGHGGVATAQLKARRITIEGHLEGNATGDEKVEVGASGHVEGDVRAPAVQFAEGAFFEGNVEMRRPKSSAPEEAEASEAAAGETRPSAAPSPPPEPAAAKASDEESSDDAASSLPPGPGRLQR